MAPSVKPSDANSTIRDRRDSECALFLRRTLRSSASRSSLLSSIEMAFPRGMPL
jgi:hypothetical protein